MGTEARPERVTEARLLTRQRRSWLRCWSAPPLVVTWAYVNTSRGFLRLPGEEGKLLERQQQQGDVQGVQAECRLVSHTQGVV